jgi:hypothetical protein
MQLHLAQIDLLSQNEYFSSWIVPVEGSFPLQFCLAKSDWTRILTFWSVLEWLLIPNDVGFTRLR